MRIREAIRQLFLAPEPFYSADDAAGLLGWSVPRVRAAIDDGDIDAERTGSGHRIAWDEVAAVLVSDQPPSLIEDALGDDAAVLPEFVRLGELRVRIPRYAIVLLEALAARDDISVGELLARHLLDLADAQSDWLAAAVPDFAEAMRWPERTKVSATAEANDTLPAIPRAPAACAASSRSNVRRGGERPPFDTRPGRVPASGWLWVE